MSRNVYHVTPVGDAWGVRRARRIRSDSIHLLKTDAVARAKRLAKAASLGQVKVHGRNGRIQTEFTYVEDSRSSRG
ncbi:MAG: DUF2188 domain-containing protein [Gammaproteobacteria bacterium]